jgi:hypothetical protein
VQGKLYSADTSDGVGDSTLELIQWLRLTRAPVAARDLHMIGTQVRHRVLERVLHELRSFGVPTRLRFVWSADGSGVADDRPRVVLLHRNLVLANHAPASVRLRAQRLMSFGVEDVSRHEIGHALLMLAPKVGASRSFLAHFGDVRRAYRIGEPVNEVVRRLERHGGLANPRYRRVVSLYAAAHPHERFAEAVRIALATGGDSDRITEWLARHDVDRVVGEQIRYAADWLAGYRLK